MSDKEILLWGWVAFAALSVPVTAYITYKNGEITSETPGMFLVFALFGFIFVPAFLIVTFFEWFEKRYPRPPKKRKPPKVWYSWKV